MSSILSTQCRRRRHPQPGRAPSRRRAALLALSLLALTPVGCALFAPPRTGLHVVSAPDPSDAERYCAWYGDADARTLFAGLAPFWSSMRAAGDDPRADLERPGPQWVGRFDLAEERWLPPLDVGSPDARTGVWDVLVAGDGSLYFTVFHETSGRVDPTSGEVRRFERAGVGLNELAPGPDGRVLVSRYGGGGVKAGGELLTLDPDGSIARRWPMPAPLGWFAAPKTPAWNPSRRRLVATTDLLPEFDGEPRHDAYVFELDQPGWSIQREPELQFVAASADGVEYRVEAHPDGQLWLRRIRPPGDEPNDQWVLLDPQFPASLDFAQDLKIMPDQRLVVTRWSGAVHVVSPDGSMARVQLPRLEPDGLYYTAVIHGERLCATYCAGVTVVCTDAP
jgi:hypothetical protein